MYETLLVFSDEALLRRVRALPIWGEKSNFEVSAAECSGSAAYEKMKGQHYDLVVVQAELNGLNGFQLLQRARAENLCSHVVIYSEFFDYGRARQSIIYGAFDYFWHECGAKCFLSVFARIKRSMQQKGGRQLKKDDVLAYFTRRDSKIHEALPILLDDIYFSSPDPAQTELELRAVYKESVSDLFAANDWLELYADEKELLAHDELTAGEDFKTFCADNLLGLFDMYCELFPKVNNDKFKEVLLFILRNPEGRLKQKTIAADLYFNSSFLSIMFTSQLQRRFVDYLTAVKFYRACFLLKQTDLPIGEIALRLDYKDTGYFSHLFKKRCGMTPSQYRMPDGYDYQI